jgi:hypothetical protein
MTMFRLCLVPMMAVTLASCGVHEAIPTPGQTVNVADWRQMATDADRERLRDWRKTWLLGVAAVQKSGKGALLDAEGPLFDPDRAIDGAVPPPGRYRCRVFKLGANGTAMADLTVYPASDCWIEVNGAVSSFYKTEGAQRPNGVIFHNNNDSNSRATFLGTMMLGDETRIIDYGRDHKRDMIGFVDRVAAKRWRLVLPSPGFESLIDVIELVPASS